MIKKLWEWICLVMGVTPPGEEKTPPDKWAKIRTEHKAWEKSHPPPRDTDRR
ncbi:MAG TPA: hypothetical protein VG797_10375 [Phycisphaerales bacterium]|nr:hypothetical protein [Phycisphaerales bacterium]